MLKTSLLFTITKGQLKFQNKALVEKYLSPKCDFLETSFCLYLDCLDTRHSTFCKITILTNFSDRDITFPCSPHPFPVILIFVLSFFISAFLPSPFFFLLPLSLFIFINSNFRSNCLNDLLSTMLFLRHRSGNHSFGPPQGLLRTGDG